MRRRLAIVALAAVSLGLASCDSSPTEPNMGASARQILTLRVETIGGASGGVLTVFNDACACAMSPVVVAVNGVDAGSATACGVATDLPFSIKGGSVLVSARSTDASGNPIASGNLAGVTILSGDTSGLSLSVRVGCSTR